MMIELRAINPSNHEVIRRLSVHPGQTHLVASVDHSLADAYVYDGALFRAAFVDDVPVGYTLIFPFEQGGSRIVNIVRLMIDKEHQGQGLGRALVETILVWIRELTPAVDTVRISTLPDNALALHLYRSLGFVERGTEAGEVALYLALAATPDA